MSNNFSQARHRRVSVLLTLVAITLLSLSRSTQGQTVNSSKTDQIEPPRSETFRQTAGLMIPWAALSQTCNSSTPNPRPDCRIYPDSETKTANPLSIYDGDGEFWYAINIEPKDPDYFLRSLRTDFRPLGPIPRDFGNGKMSAPSLVILRLVGESKHWFEVEINERTRATRFILKSDPFWSRVTWADIFNMSFEVYIDSNHVKVLDRPNGEELAACTKVAPTKLVYAKLEGDWMLVNEWRGADARCKGWIRWRKGRTMLIGSIINGMRFPAEEYSR